MPLSELFLWTDPENFSKVQMDEVYLLVDYVDQSNM